MGPNGNRGPAPAPSGWCSGWQSLEIGIAGPDGNEIGPPLKANIIVQLVPLGFLVLGMALAETTDDRVPEIARTVPLTWVAKLPALTLNLDPLTELGTKAIGQFTQFAGHTFGEAVFMATTPGANLSAALGNG